MTPIEVLKGLTQDAAVAMKQSGFDTVESVVAADPDKLAYLVDSYDIAETIFAEARRYLADVPRPRSEAPKGESQRPPAPTGSARVRGDAPDAAAKPLVAACKSLSKLPHDASVAPRLEAAALVLRAGASASAAAAAFAVDAWFSDAPAIGDLNDQVRDIVREVLSILSVPIGPTGKAGAHYPETVARASEEARLVACACTLVALGTPLDDGPASHATIVSNAIIAAGSGPLVGKLQDALRSPRKPS